MDVNVISSLIGSLGFPIFVAIWMLMKGSKDSENITNALNDLRQAITILTSKVNDKGE